jgi:4-oxalocrotonate tautomerase
MAPKRSEPARCGPAKQARRRTRAPGEEETAMPFVNIRILEGHSQQRKDEISKRVTDAISSIAEVPKEAIWVVWEDVKATDWYVGDNTVAKLKARK